MNNPVEISLFLSAALAVFTLYIGMKVKETCLKGVCIPSPVIGGILFSLVILVVHYLYGVRIKFNPVVEEISLMVFLTAIGFEFDFVTIRKSLKFIILVFIGVIVLMFSENLLAVVIGSLLNIDSVTSLASGTLKVFQDKEMYSFYLQHFSDLGVVDAKKTCDGFYTLSFLLSALFGGIFGSFIIRRHQLKPQKDSNNLGETPGANNQASFYNIPASVYQLIIAMGIGYGIAELLEEYEIDIPAYIISMFVAVGMTNYSIKSGRFKIYSQEQNLFGVLGLSLFLGLNFMTMELWNIFALSYQYIALILLQVIVLFVLIYILIFLLAGKNYDSAVVSAGCSGILINDLACGFSSVMVVNNTFGSSVKAFLVTALLSALIVNALNPLIINFFICQL